MSWILFYYFFVALTSSTFAGVLKEGSNICSEREFACADGACVSLDRVCDGAADCSDGRDEQLCSGTSIYLADGALIPKLRSRRQSQCRKSQWACRDGTCIAFDGKCDGAVDCPDGSDETHALCRNMSGKFKCADGTVISSSSMCDGVADCTDKSDETVPACGHIKCPTYLFQCAYGACVDQGSDCDGKIDCADGSDENDQLCNRSGTGTGRPTGTVTTSRPSPGGGACVLPQFPSHGTFTVNGDSSAKPGQAYEQLYLNVTCNRDYGVVGSPSVFCVDGTWSGDVPKCVRFCKLTPHSSVEYRCTVPDSQGGYRECHTSEPAGTVVVPRCRAPNYYSPRALPAMHCIDGSWDYLASQICQPECGKVTSEGTQLIIDGRSAKRGELPWHVGIYQKTFTPYKQICGGTIVSTTLVISAAHCFYTDHALPAKNYAVAAGKIYRPWNDQHDVDPQKRDVSRIKIPSLFLGAEGHYQEDIALVFVSQAFEYKTYIRPVCLSFDVTFEKQQMVPRLLGKVAGWGYTTESGDASQVLKVVELPYVTSAECLAKAPTSFRGYITSDKICAGWENGTALCQGDSGGGLVFPTRERDEERFYLRGIVSTAPRNDNRCNKYALTAFTRILSHEDFIKPDYSVD